MCGLIQSSLEMTPFKVAVFVSSNSPETEWCASVNERHPTSARTISTARTRDCMGDPPFAPPARRCIRLDKPRLPGQPFELVRGDNPVVLRVGLVITLRVAGAVDVIGHQAHRLLQPVFRDVAEPVQPLQTGAVRQMK